MTATWCFSCGATVPKKGGGLAVVCDRCTQAGRRAPREQIRWVVRTQDGGTRGPMSHDGVVDQLARGALDPFDSVARVGGPWRRLCEHQDFRPHFLPGSPEASALLADQRTEQKDKDAYVSRKRWRFIGAAAFALGGVGLAIATSQQGLLVVPEAQMNRLLGFFEGVSGEVTGQIDTVVAPEKAVATAMAQREIPGQPLIDALQAKWTGASGPSSLHLARGRAALWEGTLASTIAAQEHFEKALALAPDDCEAASGLARAAARMEYADASLADTMSMAAERAAALAPESPAALLARAEVALASGSPDLAQDLAARCGAPADLAGTRGAEVDLGCAVLNATLGHNIPALEVLDGRFPSTFAIQLGLAEARVFSEDYALAREIIQPLTRAHREESGPWRLQLAAASPVGEWDAVIDAGRQIRSVDPARLAERQLLAEVLLKVKGDGAASLAEYEALIAHPGFEDLSDRARLFADAAAAAVAAGSAARGVELAEQSLRLDSGAPGAIINRARALQALGKQDEAQAALRDVDLNRVTGNLGARYHVAAARIFLENGLARQAVAELRGASESDPAWPSLYLVSAEARLLVGNLGGAIEDIEKVAYLDRAQDDRRSPLQEVWYPAPDWRSLRRELESQLSRDARFAARGPAAVAVVSWYAGMSDRERVLNRALEAGAEVPAAHAARSQQLLERGSYQAAYSQAEQILSSTGDLTFVHALKGRCLMELGRRAEARAAFTKATDEPHQIAGVYRLMAEAKVKAGDNAGAIDEYKEVLKRVPDDLQARVALLDLQRGDR